MKKGKPPQTKQQKAVLLAGEGQGKSPGTPMRKKIRNVKGPNPFKGVKQ